MTTQTDSESIRDKSKILEEPPRKDSRLECGGCDETWTVEEAEHDSTRNTDPEEGPHRPHQPVEHFWNCPTCGELLALYSEASATVTRECPICGEENKISGGVDAILVFCDKHNEEEVQQYIDSKRSSNSQEKLKDEKIPAEEIRKYSEAYTHYNTNEIRMLKKQVRVLKQQNRRQQDRIEELEESIENEGDKVRSQISIPIAEVRCEERQELTEKQSGVYEFVLYNPEASRNKIVSETGMNTGNLTKCLNQILEKGWQIPVSTLENMGLEDEIDFSG